jgi:hypothetical protein
MRTKEFLEKILPPFGTYVLASDYNNEGKPNRIETYTDIDDMAESVDLLSANGGSVYHANATFKHPKGNSTRNQENVSKLKTLFADVDVKEDEDGTKSYQSKKQAAADVVRVVKELGLPAPMIVASGGGFHLYWPFKDAVDVDEWQPLANALKRALRKHGLKIDPSVTGDSARVLRPVGAMWRKREPNVEVKLVKDAPASDIQTLKDVLLDKYDELFKNAPRMTGLMAPAMDLSPDYPPASADLIALKCKAIHDTVNDPNHASEPVWRGMIGVIKYTEECKENYDIIHKWSEGYDEYDYDETQEKIELWTKPPTLCEYFDCEGMCEGCQYKGNIKSPISLGTVGDKIESAPAPQPTVPASQNVQTTGRFLPKGYRSINGGIAKEMLDDENNVIPVQVTTSSFYISNRIRLDTGEYALLAHREKYSGEWEEFRIPTKALPNQRLLAETLSAYEVYTVGKNGVSYLAELCKAYGDELRHRKLETVTHRSFGWVRDAKDEITDEFIIGTKSITPNDMRTVLCSEHVPEEWTKEFTTKGTKEQWIDAINRIYNRKGAEVYQIILLAAFASPVISMLQIDGWHGIPIALVSDSGSGKTTAALMACSIYGDPSKFLVNTNTQTGATMMALMQRIATARNIPIILDETTMMEPDEFVMLLYTASNGIDKLRLGPNGKPLPRLGGWDLFTIMTTNESPNDVISAFEKRGAQDATKVRCFEIDMSVHASEKVFNDETYDAVQEMNEIYGEIGIDWIRNLMEKRDEIVSAVRKKIAWYAKGDTDESSKERFYLRTEAMIMEIGEITKELGYHDFDMEAIKKKLREITYSLRERRSEQTMSPEGFLGRFLAQHHADFIVTKRFAKATKHNAEVPLQMPRNEIAGRIAKEDGVFMVSYPVLTDWCRKQGITIQWLVEQLMKQNYIVQVPGSERRNDGTWHGTARAVLGRGTTVPSTQTKVIALDYDRVTVADHVRLIDDAGHAAYIGDVEA